MLAQGIVAKCARRLDQIIENRFLAGQDFDGGNHAGNDGQRTLRCSQMVLFGSNHHPVEGFLAL